MEDLDNHDGRDPGEWRISRWLVEFSSPATEHAFRKYWAVPNARHTRIAVSVWLGITIVNLFTGYFFYGFSDELYYLTLSRFLIILGLTALIKKTFDDPVGLMNGRAVTLIEMVGFVAFLLIVMVRDDLSVYWLGVMMVLILATYVFIPNRLVAATIAALFGVSGMLVTLILMGSSRGELLASGLLMCIPLVLGHISAARLHLVRREQYVLLQKELISNNRLEREIARRRVLEAELERQATTDPLTGLFNRRQFSFLYKKERERAERSGSPLCLVMIDLDHFKQVNDRHGHEGGDAVLVAFSEFLQRQVRSHDVVARLGGEEFVMLLPDTSLVDSRILVDRIKTELQELQVPFGQETISITSTFGLSQVDVLNDGMSAALSKADKALYLGKQQGRNCIITV